MTRSLLERLKNTIRDNLLDFLEVDSEESAPSLEDMPKSEIVHRLKLRLGSVEAERYRLSQLLAEERDERDFDAKANAALDAGDERLAREILRIKVDHSTARAEASEAMTELEDEASDLQKLIAVVEDDDDLDASLEQRLAQYDRGLTDPVSKTEEG